MDLMTLLNPSAAIWQVLQYGECQYNSSRRMSSRISMLLSVTADLNSYGMNNFCATTNNKCENRVCTKKKKKALIEFLFHEFTSFSDIERPLGSSHPVAFFCTIRLVGPAQIRLGEKQKKTNEGGTKCFCGYRQA